MANGERNARSVCRWGHLALKFTGTPPPSLHRARALARAGVRTPEPVWLPQRRSLATGWIEGPDGKARIASEWAAAQRGRDRGLRAHLRDLFSVLRGLHESSPVPGGIDGLDRRRRIEPRLASPTDVEVANRARGVLEVVDETAGGPGGPAVLLHGDCHAGQFACPPGTSPWILDLDDLGLGPAEHDFGNFLAHLVSSTWPGARPGDRSEWARAREWVVRSSEEVGIPLDDAALDDQAAVALVRRALKAAETPQGRHHARDVISLARAVLPF